MRGRIWWGILLRGSGESNILTWGCAFDLRQSGVSRVIDDLSADGVILLAVCHYSICVMYCCRSWDVMFRLRLCEVIRMRID